MLRLFGGAYGNLGWRQCEDQPAAADVHVGELHHVAKKGAIGIGVLAVDDHVRAVDHRRTGLLKVCRSNDCGGPNRSSGISTRGSSTTTRSGNAIGGSSFKPSADAGSVWISRF